ncbi:MAG TPA: sugar phosphate nucleotidyltransferase, partial [Caulobacteraceae bacterium]
MASIHPVILCGGAGARLWPASGPQKPKPFLNLTGEVSLLQQTALRLAAVADARRPILVVAAGHK